MTTPLTFESTTRPDAIYVSAAGELDFETHRELEGRLIELCSHQRRLELDLSSVSFIDSSGLAMLLSVRNLFAESGGMLILRAPSEKVLRVFDLAGLSTAFTIVE